MLSWSPITHASGLMTIIAVLTKCKCVIASPDLTFHKFVDTVHKFQVNFLMTMNRFLSTNLSGNFCGPILFHKIP